MKLAAIDYTDVVLFSTSILLLFLLLFGVFAYGIWRRGKRPCLSPYSRLPLRRGSDLSYSATEKVVRYLYSYQQYDNRIIELKSSAVCRETGRIFPNSIGWFDVIKVDWSFLQKRLPGNYVSWGSLTNQQQQEIREAHETLQGFQTETSSPTSSPRAIELDFALAKPGPLYVDINTKTLVGWKCVPETDLEVLIVQKPKNLKTNY